MANALRLLIGFLTDHRVWVVWGLVEIAVIVHVHAFSKAMKLHFANFMGDEIIFMAFSSDFHGILTNPYFIVS